MPTLLQDSNSDASAANEVTVRVVADGRGRRSRLGSLVSTVLVGALAVGALVVAGVLTGVISITNPFSTSTVDRSTPALLHELTDLSKYSAARGHFQQTIDVEDDVAVLPAFLAGERTTFLATGTVDATVDFSNLSKDAVQTADDGSVTITLPEPKLDRAAIDPRTSRVVGRERGVVDRVAGIFNDTPTGEQRFYVLAQEKIGQAARRSKIVERAEKNTTTMLQGFLGKLGYTTVNVAFESPGAAKASNQAA